MESRPKLYRKTLIIEGICFLILGLIGIFTPILLTFAVELLVGGLFLAGGLVEGWRTLTAKKLPGFWPSLLSSILYVIVGILLLFFPLRGVVTLTLLLAFFFLFEGIFQIVFATTVRPLKNWGWLAFSGVLSLIMAFIIWAGWPATSLWVIGLLVGINLLFYGLSRLFISGSYSHTKS